MRFVNDHNPSLFETLANAVACQQISLNVGIALLNRLAEGFDIATGRAYAFPRPQDLLAGADPSALRAFGFSFAKVRTLLNLAKLCESGMLEKHALARRTDVEVSKQLLLRHTLTRPGY